MTELKDKVKENHSDSFFEFSFPKKEHSLSIIEYAENYDPEEDFAMWIEARKRDKSVPGPAELWEDQLWKQKTLKDIAEEWADTNGEKEQ